MVRRTAFGLAIMVLLFGSCFAPDVCPFGQTFDCSGFETACTSSDGTRAAYRCD